MLHLSFSNPKIYVPVSMWTCITWHVLLDTYELAYGWLMVKVGGLFLVPSETS